MSAVALVLVLSAALAHASWNVLAHGASRDGAPFLWWGAVFGTVLWAGAIPFTGGVGGGTVGQYVVAVAVSAVLHVAYMVVLQRGYATGMLSTVYATARGTGPLLSVVLAVVLLHERPGALPLVGVAVVILAVVWVGVIDSRTAPPGGRSDHRSAMGFGLLTGVTIAAYTVWDAHALSTWSLSPVAYMVGCTALEIPLFTALLGRRRAELGASLRRRWRSLVAFGVLSPLSYILVLTAFRHAPVALVAPAREVSVVMVSLFGALVLREGRPALRIAASVGVVVGIVLLSM